MTKRRMRHEAELAKVRKSGALKTFFTLIKGFVGTGVLFLPKGFKNGGYIFSPIILTASSLVTLFCAMLLIKVRQKFKGSFSDLGYQAYGRRGKIGVDLALGFSQVHLSASHRLLGGVRNSVYSVHRREPTRHNLKRVRRRH